MEVQTNSMIAIYQGDSTVTIYPLKIYGFRPDLGLTKRRAKQLKPKKFELMNFSINQRNCMLKLYCMF